MILILLHAKNNSLSFICAAIFRLKFGFQKR